MWVPLGALAVIALFFLPNLFSSSPNAPSEDAPGEVHTLPPEALGLDPVDVSGVASAATAAPRDVLDVARPYAPWDEKAPLRGVGGLVRDALTRQPIAGAWITWRLPPPAVADRVLGDPAFDDRRFGMISDEQGRFAVDRLPHDVPLSTTLFAVARGYAYAAVPVGLERELTIDLVPMGSLEVLVYGKGTPHVTLRSKGREAGLEHLPTWGDGGVFRIPHLEPGNYTVQLDRDSVGPSADVSVVAGQVSRVELRRRRPLRFKGNLAWAGRLRPNSELLAVHETTYAQAWLKTDRFGAFDVALAPGRYAVFLIDGRSQRRIPGFVEPGQGEVPLELTPPSARVTLRLTRGDAPYSSDGLGLVQLDAPATSLISPDATREPGVFVATGEPGRYALFDGPTYWGQVDMQGEVSLDLTPRTLQVQLLGLEALEAGEVVRGEVVIVPPSVRSARPDLSGRLEDGVGEPFTVTADSSLIVLPLGPPGTYIIYGRTEAGSFRQQVELSATTRVVRCELRLLPSE